MMDWYHQFKSDHARYWRLSSQHQQAMLDVLRRERRRYSFFPMPATFNFREVTLPSSFASTHLDGGGVVVLHDHILGEPASQRAQIRAVASRFANSISRRT
jgi:hypothetical protein